MDFTFPLTQQPALTAGQGDDLDEDWTSSLNPQPSNTQSLLIPGEEDGLYDDNDVTLNFGDDDIEFNDTTVSFNVGRNAPTPRPDADNILDLDEPVLHEDDAISLNYGDDVPMLDQPELAFDDINLPPVGDDEPLALPDDETLQLRQAAGRVRDTDSPLSEADAELLRHLDSTFQIQHEGEDVQDIVARQPQRSRKQKPIGPDVETVLHNSQIKAQAEDRSKILRPPSFLPRDPILLTLMNMQKNGDFVLNAMNDGRSRNWAPELQGLLSFDALTRSGDRKRKRDSGIGGLSEDEHSEKSPRLDRPDDDDEGVHLDDQLPLLGDIPTDDGVVPLMSEGGPALEDIVPGEDDEGIYGGDDGFDDTTIPLVHPADSGPVSLGTKHAVHLLREKLGDPSGQESSSPAKKSVLLQDLVPERRTTKEDATKMFFEVLVLATKDAIKVDQGEKQIGLPLRIRAKRGLWGSWAETSPADDPTSQSQAAPPMVSVEA